MMEMVPIFSEMHLSLPGAAGRMALAAGLGAVIGVEREWRERSAGLRTHMLVALSASILSILMIEMMASPFFMGEHVEIDPVAVLEAVMTGVAFLAAGVIIRARGEVRGLTTGAGLWLAGALGTAAGAGYGAIASIGALFGLFIILVLRWFEPRRHDAHRGARDHRKDTPPRVP